MTLKEAIDNITEIQGIITDVIPVCDPDDDWGRYTITLNVAKKALEKQVEKKTEIYTDTRNYMDMYGNVTDIYEVDVYECPNCGAYITERYKDDTHELVPNYCNDCGQKLDWSEEE